MKLMVLKQKNAFSIVKDLILKFISIHNGRKMITNK